ncbi:hypothetical protein AaE_001836 [Aphanomyces astaci]|uniref:Reverse transcriptase RNase H-like domain-containing protein n=1 Tax=Aphanomyces astaci TaxID=112090 RepID=A0A6A5B0S1_APHAT|nr:hypothetical protein AaE_001836 [Aphanomyces astaci]
MCLFTDASDHGWSIVITQVVAFDDDSPVQEQRHELLLCQSEMFGGAIEKEAYPIARACEKLNYILMRRTGFKLCCDHKNLIHVFDPGEEWKAHTRGKLMRWAAIIGRYRYEIIHIDGIHNLWADMMSRWGQPTPSLATKRVKIRRGHGWSKKVKARKVPPPAQPKLRPLDKDFVWPCVVDIRHAQDQHGATKPKRATVVAGLWQVDERLWIPSVANDLIQRIMVVAHCGSAGHRGHAALVATIRRLFYVDHLADRASEFLRGCLLCPHVKGGRVVHRPYAPRWHAKERNEGIHFDYLYMGEAFSGAKYVLVLKDDLTHYSELIACEPNEPSMCGCPGGLDEAVRNATSLGQRPSNPFQKRSHESVGP